MAASFRRNLGHIPLVVVAAGAASLVPRAAERSPGNEGCRTGPDGHGDHLFYGRGQWCHLNPAVTLAFAVRRNFPWSRVLGISRRRSSGHRCGVFPPGAVRHTRITRRHDTRSGSERFQGARHGSIIDTGLVSTILGTASGARNIGSNGALAVGGYIVGGPLGGANQWHLDEPGALIAPD